MLANALEVRRLGQLFPQELFNKVVLDFPKSGLVHRRLFREAHRALAPLRPGNHSDIDTVPALS